MADGGSQTHQERRSSQEDRWRQRGELLEKVAQVQACIRRRMLAPGDLVETNGKQCDVRQEEEYDDVSVKVDPSYIDR